MKTTTMFAIRVPVDLLNALRAEAAQTGETVSDVARQRLARKCCGR